MQNLYYLMDKKHSKYQYVVKDIFSTTQSNRDMVDTSHREMRDGMAVYD